MKKLEDHLKLVCQMIEDENFNFHSFLKKLKKKSEGLNPFPYGLPQPGKRMAWKEEKRP